MQFDSSHSSLKISLIVFNGAFIQISMQNTVTLTSNVESFLIEKNQLDSYVRKLIQYPLPNTVNPHFTMGSPYDQIILQWNFHKKNKVHYVRSYSFFYGLTSAASRTLWLIDRSV